MDRNDWRHSNACIRCHTLKLKCRRPSGKSACIRCTKHNVACAPRMSKRYVVEGHHGPPSQADGNISRGSLPTPTSLVHDEARGTHTAFQPGLSSFDRSLGAAGVFDELYEEDPNGWFDRFSSNDGFHKSFPTSISPAMSTGMAMSNSHTPPGNVEELVSTAHETMDYHASVPGYPVTTQSGLASASESPVLYDWLGDLGQLSGELFMHSASYTTTPATQSGHSLHHFTSTSTPKSDPTSSICTLASRYSTLVEAIVPDDSRMSSTEQPSSSEALSLLRDQTNSMLLSSTYMRLLRIFSSMLGKLEEQLYQRKHTDGTGADISHILLQRAGINVEFQTLANQPIAETFLFVNLVLFHVHRIGRSLERLMEPARTNPYLAREGEASDSERKILEVIPEVVFERQAAVLRDFDKLHTWLLNTRGP